MNDAASLKLNPNHEMPGRDSASARPAFVGISAEEGRGQGAAKTAIHNPSALSSLSHSLSLSLFLPTCRLPHHFLSQVSSSPMFSREEA